MKIISSISIAIFCIIPSADASERKESFQKVFNVLASPQIFSISFDNLEKKLSDICAPSKRTGADLYKYGNFECKKEAEVAFLNINGDEKVSFIQGKFGGAEKCPQMKDLLIKNFGKPTSIKEDCTMTWRLKPLKKGVEQRYIKLERGAGNMYFEIGEEQGP